MANETAGIRSRLRDGEYVSGIWLMTPSLEFAELVRIAGLDFVVIDLEHGLQTLDTALAQMRVLQGARTSVIVRIPNHDPSLVSRLLDRGADGIMVPKVPDAQVARTIADAARFPPDGTRGLALRALRASGYGANASYRAHADASSLVMVQIETRQAMENLEEICAVPGVDMIFIGPADLSADLRLEGEANAERFAETVDGIASRARATGILVGAMPVGNCTAARLKQAQVQLVVIGSDIGIMSSGLERHAAELDASGY